MLPNKYIPLLVVSFILLFSLHRRRLRNVIKIIHGKMVVSPPNEATSGVSGHVFTGEQTRTFTKRLQNTRMIPMNRTHICSKWAVVTTINAPTLSIHKVMNQTNLCVVIVADRKTPTKEYRELESERIYFLSVEKQEKMQDMAITTELPWNHFGRKNLGYLYAIQHGAEVIFDFDDDNELISDIPFKTSEPWFVADETQVFNPYPMFVELEDVAWPRGFPLTQIQNISTWQVPKFTTINPNIGVVQSLANHDPDMDAIWRLTRKLPLNFDSDKRVVLPPGTYSSYNAQATIHHALWGTLLPVSVHGRVSDIWRSYIMQRLMHDVGQVIGFVSPFVKQVRNAHNYQGDYMSERPLFEKTEALLRVLSEWKGKSDIFEERFVELFVELYERDFIEIKDVYLAQKWIRTLQQMKYMFPQIHSELSKYTKAHHHADGGRVLLGQFNWHTSESRLIEWRNLWSTIFPMDKIVMYVPRTDKWNYDNVGSTVMQYKSDGGYYSPYKNLLHAISQTRATEVIMVHDDMVLSHQFISRNNTDEWAAVSWPKNKKKIGRFYRNGTVVARDRWSWTQTCVRSFKNITQDIRMLPFWEQHDGGLPIYWGQSDFIKIAIEKTYTKQLETLLHIFGDHDLFLECALPTAVAIVNSMYENIILYHAALCTDWTSERKNPDTWDCIDNDQFEVFHPIKPPKWSSYFTKMTIK